MMMRRVLKTLLLVACSLILLLLSPNTPNVLAQPSSAQSNAPQRISMTIEEYSSLVASTSPKDQSELAQKNLANRFLIVAIGMLQLLGYVGFWFTIRKEKRESSKYRDEAEAAARKKIIDIIESVLIDDEFCRTIDVRTAEISEKIINDEFRKRGPTFVDTEVQKVVNANCVRDRDRLQNEINAVKQRLNVV